MIIDLRQIMIATLWKKYEKKINNEKIKEAIRNNEATYKFADYGIPKKTDSSKTHYYKDGKEISINTEEIIKQYCKDNSITIEKEKLIDYKVEFVPSQKAIKEFNRMLDDLKESEHLNLGKLADEVQKVMK